MTPFKINWDKLFTISGISLIVLFTLAIILKARVLLIMAELLGAFFFIALMALVLVAISKKFNLPMSGKNKNDKSE